VARTLVVGALGPLAARRKREDALPAHPLLLPLVMNEGRLIVLASVLVAVSGCGNGTGQRQSTERVAEGESAANGEARGSQGNPGIAPPNSNPSGASYSEWAARWWTWALAQPAAVNPVLDETGAHCAQGQSGHVWFLAGTFTGDIVTRSCSIPAGKALLVPIVNDFYGAFLTDPPDQRTEAFVRAQVACVGTATGLSAEIDGVPVDNPTAYLEKSPLFDVTLPADNIAGLPAGFVLSPSVDEGFYLFLRPLSTGEHTLHFHADAVAGCVAEQDVTYDLTVGP
jgi:hypothetical protein